MTIHIPYLPSRASAMDAVTADQVLQVLQVLYAGTATDNAGRKEADTWLNDFQKTPNAWAISDQLLRTETLPQEARLFAAQTLRQKVEFDFSQLEPSAQERLKESLIAFLHNYRAGPKSVLKQLSLSLADLAIQLSAWTDPVRELIAVFGKNAEMISPLLEFLIVLPEEFLENRRIRMDDEDLLIRANQVLRKNAQDILQLLIFYFTQSAADYELQERIFQCLFSWIYNGEIQPEAVLATPLFDHAFAALHVDELFESAVDVTCEILYRTRKNPSSHIIEMIYPRLVALRTLLNENLEDTDIIRGLCRIFADAGEAWVARIAESYDTYAVVIDGLLQCTACEDLEIVRISFNFWNALASEVIKPPNEAQRLKYVAVFQKLEDIMIAHLQYPDEAATWTAEERDEFREFRHTMGDVLKDCVRVIGAEEALNRPSSILSSFVVDPSTGAFDSSVQWQKIEAPLFALRAMCREVSTRESTVVPKIMAMLPHLPPHPKIKYAAILVIGRYAEWTAHHPDFIPYQLTFVSQGFENDPDTNAAAAQALKYLCKSCGKLLVNFLEQLHPFYLTTIKKISREDARDLTEAIAYVIAEVPSDNLLQTFQMFCAPVAQRLHEIAHQARPTGEAEEALIVEAADQLGYLALFIKYVRPSIPHDQPHPCASLVMQLWPILDALLSTYGNVEEIADACSRVCSHSMRSYGLHIAPILTPMMSKIVALFDATGLPCYLWVSKRCVEAYASDEKEEGKVIFSIVETLTASTFKRFSASQDKLDAIPDVIEDYFDLVLELVEQCPVMFCQSALLASVLDCAIACLRVEHREALLAVLAFLKALCQSTSPTQRSLPVPQNMINPVVELINQKCAVLAESLVAGLLYNFPRDRDVVNDVAAMFVGMMIGMPDRCQDAMKTCIQRIPETQLPFKDRDDFLARFASTSTEYSDHYKLASLLQEFAASFRRRNLIRGHAR